MNARLVIFAAVLCASPFAQAQEDNGIINDTQQVFYDVSASSFSKLGKRMKKAAPPGQNGKTKIGETASKWKLSIETTKSQGHCETANVVVTLTSTTTAPRWLEYNDASLHEQKAWDAFQEGLREHANGHIDIGLETVAEMRKSLLEVPPATTCEALKAQMQIYVDGAKAKFDLAHADYDKETKHGKRQGAILRKQIE